MNLKKLIWVSLIFLPLSACIQADNSSSLDEDLYGAGSSGTPEFIAARTVFRTNCIPCHDYGSKSEDGLLAAGLFTPADAVNSPIYYRLVGSSGAGGPKDMPQSGGLSANDIAIVKTWIDGTTP
jgi:hypothetical protein